MILHITATTFSADIKYPQEFPAVVGYMKGWSLMDITRHCLDKGWTLKVDPTPWRWDEVERHKVTVRDLIRREGK